jgi:hypothetical protein
MVLLRERGENAELQLLLQSYCSQTCNKNLPGKLRHTKAQEVLSWGLLGKPLVSVKGQDIAKTFLPCSSCLEYECGAWSCSHLLATIRNKLEYKKPTGLG